MITEKQKCIAEQATYGDLCGYMNNEIYPIKWITDNGSVYHNKKVDNRFYRSLLETTPILRPMSDLTKEITHKGYNDDKPFIPLMELAKIWGSRNDYTPIHVFPESLYVQCSSNKNGRDFYYCADLENMSQEELDLLNLLHFDTRGLIEAGEAISVHDLPKNPYEV